MHSLSATPHPREACWAQRLTNSTVAIIVMASRSVAPFATALGPPPRRAQSIINRNRNTPQNNIQNKFKQTKRRKGEKTNARENDKRTTLQRVARSELGLPLLFLCLVLCFFLVLRLALRFPNAQNWKNTMREASVLDLVPHVVSSPPILPPLLLLSCKQST